MITVIIPTLNEEKYIGRLLEQLKKQKYAPLEIIVVDADSDDKTLRVLKKYTGIKVIKTKERNTSYQRNLGAKKAKGELLVFIDADMRLPNNFFMHIINQSMQHCVGGYCKVKVHPSEAWLRDKLFVDGIHYFLRVVNMIVFVGFRGGCIIARKSVFDSIGGFNEHLHIAEDVDLLKRLHKKGKIAYISRPVYESPRRYHQQGHLSVLWQWTKGGVRRVFHGKAHKQSYKAHR